MIFLLIRVTGDHWNPSELIARFNIQDCGVWSNGDAFKTSLRGFHKDTGFAFSLPDAQSWVVAQPSLIAMLSSNVELFQAVKALNLKAELRLGVTVGEEASFVPSLDFSTELISMLHEANISMEISAYPTSNE
jgi:hypothetical protein